MQKLAAQQRQPSNKNINRQGASRTPRSDEDYSSDLGVLGVYAFVAYRDGLIQKLARNFRGFHQTVSTIGL
jgi:hypothetical protein